MKKYILFGAPMGQDSETIFDGDGGTVFGTGAPGGTSAWGKSVI